MKVMINKPFKFFTLIFLTCISCAFYRDHRENIVNPIHLSYSNKNIVTNIELESRDIDYKSYYCGKMTSRLLSDENPKELRLIYDNKEFTIHADTIVDVVNFWGRSNWNNKGFRQEKICISFEGLENIDWSLVKFTEYEIKKSITIEEVCAKFKNSLSPKNKKLCE